MRLYYYKDPAGNFGDDLNSWLWTRLLPGIVDVRNPVLHPDSSLAEASVGPLFIGMGTLLNSYIPEAPRKVVFGTGTGYRTPAKVDESWDIYCVRGPLTARTLGLNPNKAIADPAILIRNFEWPTNDKMYGLSFVPHHNSIKMENGIDWESLCGEYGVHFIDPTKSPGFVISEVARSKSILSESLHGAIVADALRIPWSPASFHNGINSFKWKDWCMSIGIEYRPVAPIKGISLTPKASYLGRMEEKIKRAHVQHVFRKAATGFDPILSTDQKMEELTARLTEKLHHLSVDYRTGILSR